MIEHYELTGYGPSHPRAAFILVATQDLSDPVESMQKSIASILETTDRNRILVICAVFQQNVLTQEEQEAVNQALLKLDGGVGTHWHGTTQHTHSNAIDSDGHSHGHKIKTIFSDSTSVSSSRKDAATYIKFLSEEHEQHKLKAKEEQIITILMRPDSIITTSHWIDTVSHALISKDGTTQNAISFASSSTETINEGETKSINLELKPIKSHASNDAMTLTQGQSYPSPILEGSVTAMTLETFHNLPVKDLYLDSHFGSDLELSLNLWMCADGIDIVSSLKAQTTLGVLQHKDKAGMMPSSMVRLVNVWMGKESFIGKKVLELLEGNLGVNVGQLEKDGKLKELPDKSLLNHCRTFEWFAKEVNVALEKELKQIKGEVSEKKPAVVSDGQKRGGHLAPGFEQHLKDAKNAFMNGGDSNALGQLPSKPLSETNKQIISTAKMVDLKYVDVTNGHTEDPHRGAMDENGVFGYVHDATALRKNPPPFKFVKEQVNCDKNDGDKKMLTQKVSIDFAADQAANHIAETSGKPRAKIFCLVYTIEKFHDRIPAIRETWGQKCDGFMVGSTKTDPALGTVNIPHEGPEEYNNIWQKVRSMWSYIYDNYYEDYDWFHIGGDDLFLLVENLRLYLESEEIQLAANGGERLPTGKETQQVPLFLGRRFKEQGNWDRIFNSGGSGYTMNKAALKALVVDAFPTCMPHLHTFAEDVMVAQCFRNKLKVFPFDTKDETGAERYMPFAPKHHLNYRIPKDVNSDWYANYSIDIKEGLDHCSDHSVAFHYIKGDLMNRMYAILYGHCA
ncbi:hypothetical protein CTEN210_14852 [Chaetoceros tenuissimus]|uniref:N-acetylgalactosaminide beta-1,3-galactosyltransferase n=1 Tax=Chaetoceros tenuissimus TaxID=426638 RepID=A0AAD3D5R5_9STRA|nr:hypothetical protein CTEN210_14852 [Chaetoceros tenuissimus]